MHFGACPLFCGPWLTRWHETHREVFVREICRLDHWESLYKRTQIQGEHIIDYFYEKLRPSKELLLSFLETRDLVIQGICSSDLTQYPIRPQLFCLLIFVTGNEWWNYVTNVFPTRMKLCLTNVLLTVFETSFWYRLNRRASSRTQRKRRILSRRRLQLRFRP